MRIIADTAALLSPSEGSMMGISVIPVCVSMDNHSYRDYVDIDSSDFLKRLEGGEMATSSQPAVGDLMDVLEDNREDTIVLTVADGLSGEYMTALGVRNCMENKELIHVLNTKTLGGPLHYLAGKAVRLRAQGLGTGEILSQLRESIDSSASFVIPADFSYLRRSGRITQLTSKIGGALKLLPVLTQSEDRRGISLLNVKRSWRAAAETIRSRMEEMNVNRDYLITVAHAGAAERAEKIRGWMRDAFPETETEIRELCPSLITHGGPGCIVVQTIRK